MLPSDTLSSFLYTEVTEEGRRFPLGMLHSLQPPL